MNETLIRALSFAAVRHQTQRRKGGDIPYINHPLDLLHLLVIEAKVTDNDVLCAAVLHDTVEDTGTSGEELQNIFGAAIAALVMEVTDDKTLPKEMRKQLQIERAAHASFGARLIKLGDKIANVRDMGHHPPAHWPVERIRAYIAWAHQVVGNLRGTHEVLENLFDAAYEAALATYADT